MHTLTLCIIWVGALPVRKPLKLLSPTKPDFGFPDRNSDFGFPRVFPPVKPPRISILGFPRIEIRISDFREFDRNSDFRGFSHQ